MFTPKSKCTRSLRHLLTFFCSQQSAFTPLTSGSLSQHASQQSCKGFAFTVLLMDIWLHPQPCLCVYAVSGANGQLTCGCLGLNESIRHQKLGPFGPWPQVSLHPSSPLCFYLTARNMTTVNSVIPLFFLLMVICSGLNDRSHCRVASSQSICQLAQID